MTATTPANSLQGNLRALRLPYMLEHALSAAQETQPAPAPPTCVSLKTSLPGKPPCSTTAPSPGALPPPASPSFKSMAAWDWNWPKKFNRMQIEHLLRLDFLDAHDNVILAGPTGVGKTHLALALGHAACLRGKSVLFTPAIDVVNRLSAAESTRQLHREMRRYLAPSLIILDELGYLPLDCQRSLKTSQ